MKRYTPILRSEDPFDMAGGDVDTSFPLLKEKYYRLKVVDPKIETKKDDENYRMLVFKLETIEDALSNLDKPLYAGHKFINRIGITASKKRTIDDCVRDVGALVQCLWTKEEAKQIKMRAIIDNPSLLDGRVGLWKVGISKESGTFSASNSARPLPVPEAGAKSEDLL